MMAALQSSTFPRTSEYLEKRWDAAAYTPPNGQHMSPSENQQPHQLVSPSENQQPHQQLSPSENQQPQQQVDHSQKQQPQQEQKFVDTSLRDFFAYEFHLLKVMLVSELRNFQNECSVSFKHEFLECSSSFKHECLAFNKGVQKFMDSCDHLSEAWKKVDIDQVRSINQIQPPLNETATDGDSPAEGQEDTNETSERRMLTAETDLGLSSGVDQSLTRTSDRRMLSAHDSKLDSGNILTDAPAPGRMRSSADAGGASAAWDTARSEARAEVEGKAATIASHPDAHHEVQAGWHVNPNTHNTTSHDHVDLVMNHALWEMAELNKGDTVHSWLHIAFERKLHEKSLPHDILLKLGVEHFIPTHSPQNVLVHIVQSNLFSAMVGLAVILNTTFSAFEADFEVRGQLSDPVQYNPRWWKHADTCFTVFFGVELLIRLAAYRAWFFMHPQAWTWNLFDFCLVGLSLITNIAVASVDVFFLRMMRMARVIRITRIFRAAKAFAELRKLLIAVLQCLVPLLWAVLFIAMTMFIFSLLIMKGLDPQMIQSQRENRRWMQGVRQQFDGLSSCFKTLLVVICGDDWLYPHEVLSRIGPFYSCIMPAFVIFVNIGVTNIVIGVFAEAASSCRDRDLISQSEINDIEDFVTDMMNLYREFAPGSGQVISWVNFKHFFYREEVQAFFAHHKLDTSQSHLIYELCDRNNDGNVDIREFVLGVLRMKGHGKNLDSKIMLHAINALGQDLECVRHQVKRLSQSIGQGIPSNNTETSA